MIVQSCFVCGGYDDKLQPLYFDRAPEAQPVAWIHKACLLGDDNEDERCDLRGFERLRQGRPRLKLHK